MGGAASVSTVTMSHDIKSEKDNKGSCSKCGTSINIFIRQKCSECSRNFCSKCMDTAPRKPPSKFCVRCWRLVSFLVSNTSVSHAHLDGCSVKELQEFLTRRGVDTTRCCEKVELIDLVMQYASVPRTSLSGIVRGSGVDDVEHQRHIQRLLENARHDRAAVVTNVSSPPAAPGTVLDSAVRPSTNTYVWTNGRLPSQQNPVPTLPENRQSNTTINMQNNPPAATNPSNYSPPSYETFLSTQGLNPVIEASYNNPIGNSTADDATAAAASDDDPTAMEVDDILPNPDVETSRTMVDTKPSVLLDSQERVKLSSITSRDDIENLSIRQLKGLLVTNYVDYRGCCEKNELIERVYRLWLDHSKNKQQIGDPNSLVDDDLCKICMDAIIDCILLECGHMVTCTQCGKRMAECPVCRNYVSRVVHVFKS